MRNASDFSKSLWVAGAASLLACVWVVWLGHPDFPLDDAYIVQHSVNGLLSGHETRFIGASPLRGITSPVDILLIALLALAVPAAWSQVVIAALGAVLYVVGVFRLALAYGATAVWSGILAILSVIAGFSLFHLFNGLETGLAMAGLTWTLVWFRNPVPDKSWHHALLSALPFIRPELGLLSLAYLGRSLWDLRNADGRSAQFLKIIGWLSLGAGPFILFAYLTGSTLIPSTISTKAYFFAQGCFPTTEKLLMAFVASIKFAITLNFAAIGFLVLLFSRIRYIGVSFLIIFFVADTEILPGAFFHNSYRYLYLLMPFALAGWATFISFPEAYARRTGQFLLLVAVGMAAIHLQGTWARYSDAIEFSRTELAGVSKWIVSHLPADDVILIHDAGYISLHGKQRLVDLVGLKTSSSVDIHKRYTWSTCSRDPRAIDTIAHRSGARYFVVLAYWDRNFKLTEALRAAGWSVTRVDTKRGDTKYKVYQITPPGSAQ